MWRAVAQVVAVTGADWRGLMVMPAGMFDELVLALRKMNEPRR
jgi:hypothetical protein